MTTDRLQTMRLMMTNDSSEDKDNSGDEDDKDDENEDKEDNNNDKKDNEDEDDDKEDKDDEDNDEDKEDEDEEDEDDEDELMQIDNFLVIMFKDQIIDYWSGLSLKKQIVDCDYLVLSADHEKHMTRIDFKFFHDCEKLCDKCDRHNL